MDRVEVLMATRDGERFLQEQLGSIEAQTGVDWRVVAGDDGSRDGTRALLDAFAGRTERLHWLPGPEAGVAANFLALLARPGPEGFTALADQDDVWAADHLARAVRMLGSWDADRPRIYACRTVLIDSAGRRLGRSPPLRFAPGFRNALLQCVLRGNTVVMNAAAREIVRQSGPASGGVPFHDWWIYLLLTGAGAEVIHDPIPGVSYRQHGANHFGAHRGATALLRRLSAIADGTYGNWLRRNCAALAEVPELLLPSAREDLARFSGGFDVPWLARLGAMSGSGAARQRKLETLCVLGAAALGRL